MLTIEYSKFSLLMMLGEMEEGSSSGRVVFGGGGGGGTGCDGGGGTRKMIWPEDLVDLIFSWSLHDILNQNLYLDKVSNHGHPWRLDTF